MTTSTILRKGISRHSTTGFCTIVLYCLTQRLLVQNPKIASSKLAKVVDLVYMGLLCNPRNTVFSCHNNGAFGNAMLHRGEGNLQREGSWQIVAVSFLDCLDGFVEEL
jgi:hypothetical protein